MAAANGRPDPDLRRPEGRRHAPGGRRLRARREHPGGHRPARSIAALGLGTFAHELGHALFGLADEYSFEPSCTFTKRLQNRLRPNIDNSSRRHRIKWSQLIDSGTAISTDASSAGDGTVGAFEGAGTCESGWYRPQHTCLMRSSRQDMCEVCRAEMDSVMRRL